jgi:hypothetical protein
MLLQQLTQQEVRVLIHLSMLLQHLAAAVVQREMGVEQL